MAVAFFDMDGTLIDGDTNDLSLHFFVRKGLKPKEFLSPLAEMGRLFFLGKVDINEVALFAVQPLVGLDAKQRTALLEECVKNDIAPHFKPGAKAAIAFHHQRGDVCIMVTSTNDYLALKVAEALKIEHVIASPMELKNGVLTGRQAGIIPYQQDKVMRIREFLEAQNLNLKDSWAYGDSINDLPMLLSVDHPFAVDPEKSLRQSPDFARLQEVSWL